MFGATLKIEDLFKDGSKPLNSSVCKYLTNWSSQISASVKNHFINSLTVHGISSGCTTLTDIVNMMKLKDITGNRALLLITDGLFTDEEDSHLLEDVLSNPARNFKLSVLAVNCRYVLSL